MFILAQETLCQQSTGKTRNACFDASRINPRGLVNQDSKSAFMPPAQALSPLRPLLLADKTSRAPDGIGKQWGCAGRKRIHFYLGREGSTFYGAQTSLKSDEIHKRWSPTQTQTYLRHFSCDCWGSQTRPSGVLSDNTVLRTMLVN